jgi:putative Mn2+ efflux pump MntP
MTALEILALALALSADAFSVGAALGLRYRTARQTFRLAFHFGLFQALLPLIGALLGGLLLRHVEAWDHWIAFGLLAFLGLRMMTAGLREKERSATAVDLTRGWHLVLFSLAVSIDALAAGIALPAARVPIVPAVTIFGAIATRIGNRIEIVAGVTLILIGWKIVADHLGWTG